MKKILALIVFLLFLVLAWYSWGWYKTTVVCCEQSEILIYDCKTNKVSTNSKWPDVQKGILAKRKPNKKLLITSPVFSGENNEIGIVRAKNVANLFSEDVKSNNIVFASHPSTDCETTKSNYLHETKFKWVTRNDDIVEHFNHVIINYKFDSTEEINKEQFISYFKELSTFLIESGDKIEITGHTDSDGTDEYNIELGLERAKEVQQHLLDNNVPQSQISVFSKGKSEPATTNTTPEGRQKNRRVIIHIIE